jgi:nitrogen-specific signal transduction histidine kinase
MDRAGTTKKSAGQNLNHIGPDFFNRLWDESWTYIKTVVDVVREPVLILDKDLRIMAANEPFYQTFQVKPNDVEKKIVYELGNGQWNIRPLRKLLENILPESTFFKGFEVTHDFPTIGRKVMILNARQIHFKKDIASELFPPIILLAMEDITDMMGVAEMLARRSTAFEVEMSERTGALETQIKELERKLVNKKN